MGRRANKPVSPFNSCDFDTWQNSPPFIAWARTDEMFANVIAVVQNGFANVPVAEFEGYRRAFNLLLGLRIANEPPKPTPPADYSEAAEGLAGDNEQAES